MDSKLGLKASLLVEQGLLTIDTGYMWQNYFNPLSFTMSSPGAFTSRQSNFAMNGLFVGINYTS